MGRAARNINGKVILYADKMTDSMKRAISETQRRRKVQEAYNKKHNCTPQTIKKSISTIRDEDRSKVKEIDTKIKSIDPELLPDLIQSLEKQMEDAAKRLEFEVAAVLRDKLEALKSKKQGSE